MNNVNLIGNLTSNPELRTTGTGKNVCNFSIAINSGYGENKRTDYINIQVWNKLAENLCKYQSKGGKLGISGELRSETYEKDGKKRTNTYVIANQITYLNTKKDGNIEQQDEEDKFRNINVKSEFKSNDEIELIDDDLPF